MGLRPSVLLGDREIAELSGMGGSYDLRHEGRARPCSRRVGVWVPGAHFGARRYPPLPPCPWAMVPPGPHIHRGSLKAMWRWPPRTSRRSCIFFEDVDLVSLSRCHNAST